ncbi:LOW QUALITY PROTEIN: DNA-directed RNA polymerase III subunit RPC6-like [Anomaloglossus baeobatrachus]
MAEAKVKQEGGEAAEIENRIIELCQQFPHGITNQVIQNEMPHIEAKHRAMAINRLLSIGQLDLLRNGTGLLYRLKVQTASKMKGSDNQEKLVYQIIEDAGNKGIWSRDIRYKSNLPLTEINKILKNMESKKLIKAVKSVAASKKKVYMLYNVQPDRSLTGGAWYSDQHFESEFVEVLNQQWFQFIYTTRCDFHIAHTRYLSQVRNSNGSFSYYKDHKEAENILMSEYNGSQTEGQERRWISFLMEEETTEKVPVQVREEKVINAAGKHNPRPAEKGIAAQPNSLALGRTLGSSTLESHRDT